MAKSAPSDAAQQLDRLEDWGRGSISGLATRQWARQLRHAGPWLAVVSVMAAPQALVAALGGLPLDVELIVLVGTALPACYALATVLAAPVLPSWNYRLWLFSKVAATTMTSLAIAGLLVAGPFGLGVAAPALAVASVSAAGTALIRLGFPGGSILVVAMFSLLGVECMRQHFESSIDTRTVHASGFAALSIATITALLAVASISRQRSGQ